MLAGGRRGEDLVVERAATIQDRQASAEAIAEAAPPVPRFADGVRFEEEFGRFLVAENVVDHIVLDRATNAARKTGERLDRVLTKLGLVAENQLAVTFAKFLCLDLVLAADLPLECVLPEVIEADFVRRNRILPIALADNTLSVGVVDPLNPEPVRALAYLTGLTMEVRLFALADFEKAFDTLYAVRTKDASNGSFGNGEASEIDVQRLRDIASEAPVIRLVNQIIAGAVEVQASDIHIEPNVDQVVVRYRVDGMLRTAQVLAPALRAAITSRLKIMSKLDIAERRMPQDGRIKIAIRGIDIDFRVSTIPTIFGESVVLRILDRSRVTLDFAELGFPAGQISAFDQLLHEPNGIILVTGPTGSGKTTTLYTALKSLNSSDRKIFSVEDPIEYQLRGINQVQVQAEIGMDFPHALRAILRQDPDIIMIGEIRDLEAARIAIQSSLTGHLVLSTLHTNSAAAAITRLIDIGVENYLLASTIKGVVAQRLVRKICRHCACEHRQAQHWESEFVRIIPQIESFGKPNILEARGCTECGGTGFSGRSTIAEVLMIDDEFHGLILANASDDQIGKSARARGMLNMYEMGATRVWRGETTIDEVLRATRMG
ncbi:Flp pilus assembly complex ATPase component TadA [Bradyrhizobium sp. AUGA SZCCT0051]|nr:Flp pilus assembly complex ATPase component TadA [Bradyrhizobium sp. AUGA SZCCT0124]MBR1311572.1 Flp pilus assembly complex ATPase component TadA [Bradyrhizobium sp. AUGA SZCCT0051]MBR1338808.1 Flp pilus assembly complex ATPase component TadA [Bradyrhizobium sp. AUGA SZCCT0105]MBR1353382.1 Flp pilus assembly complex ATPase component TadA [Bradyrhizobium sp. AUGA SZCCT0045]